MLRLLKYLKTKDWFYVSVVLGLIILQVWLDLKLPDYLKEITTLVDQAGKVKEILSVGLVMLLIALSSALSAIIVNFFVSRIATSFSITLKSKLYDKILSFSSEELNKFSTASLITRTTNDTIQLQRFIAMGLQTLMKAPILATWAILKILNKSWQWSIVTAIYVVILIIVISVLIYFALPKFKKVQTLIDDLNLVTRENITGVRVVRAYNAEGYQENKFNQKNENLTKNNLFINRLMAITGPFMTLLLNGLTLSIYWVGAYIINQANTITLKLSLFGDMLVFVSYAIQVIMAFLMLIFMFIRIPRVMVSANRINEILDTNAKIVSGNVKTVKDKKNIIEFKNVSFKYPNAPSYILKNINLKIQKGQTVAFIGSTGSGKSTLINLVARFYDVTEGELLINGVNIKDYDLHTLYDMLGYVSQKSVIFSGTVNSNINFGNNQNVNKNVTVEEASSIAQASEFIDKMENKYDSSIAESGTNLSGGQKQRVSIARAIHRNAQIYLFDDSFSALDYKTDFELRKTLKEKLKHATKLIVAQRIGTIKDADLIVVLDNGEIVGLGTHNDLLKTCEVYKEIALSQLSKKELKNE